MFLVTAEQVAKFAPNAKDPSRLEDAVNAVLNKYDISQSPRRVRYFMAQAGFETAMFTKWVEDLTYTTPSRIATVWPTRFYCVVGDKKVGRGLLNAEEYVRNPQKLANEVYANRVGNGSPSSGHGFKFRGRGAFHLTFLDNYRAASLDIYGDLRYVDNPDMVAEYEDGLITAGWFWNTRNFNALADRDEFTNMTSRLNGATGSTLTRVVNERLPILRNANQTFVW